MVAKDPIKQPDMSRNEALAGKTVYTCGKNVHYDQLGYAVWSSDPHKERYAGTTRSAKGQPIEDALAGKPFEEDWAGLIPWNEPGAEPLTAENEAAYREQYYAKLAAEDAARRKRDDD